MKFFFNLNPLFACLLFAVILIEEVSSTYEFTGAECEPIHCEPTDITCNVNKLTNEIDCCKDPDICSRIICPSLVHVCNENSGNQTIVSASKLTEIWDVWNSLRPREFPKLWPKAPFCGCCDVCVHFVDPAKDCELYSESMATEQVSAGMPLILCPAGYKCDKKKCIEIDASSSEKFPKCLKDRQNRKTLKNSINEPKLRTAAWTPECNKLDGNYKPKQCKDHKCICVDPKTGERTFGQAPRTLAENMTCACSLAAHGRKQISEPQEHCTETGDYEELQCVEDICYCADPKTGKPKGHVTTIKALSLLDCYKEDKHPKEYLKPCEKQTVALNKVIADYMEKGVLVYGVQQVKCDLDGTFEQVQCDGRNKDDSCKCTNKKGTSIASYKVHPTKISNASCLCARDEYENDYNNGRYPYTLCQQDGSFENFQCYDHVYESSNCICIDEDGDILWQYDKDHEAVKDNRYATQACNKLIQDLKNI